MQYLYSEPDGYVFMDTETYDQMSVTVESLGDTANYVIEGASVVLLMYGTEVVGSDLPASVPLTISETEPGIQGDRVSGATKPAILETGLVVQVPLFIEQGEVVKVDTRTGSYISRA
jgi:elongation factor P